MTAAVVCRSCGAEPRVGARFCDACGSPIASSTDPAEYKQVTVLFADVVRSMEFAAVLDPERLREIMTEVVHIAKVQRNNSVGSCCCSTETAKELLWLCR